MSLVLAGTFHRQAQLGFRSGLQGSCTSDHKSRQKDLMGEAPALVEKGWRNEHRCSTCWYFGPGLSSPSCNGEKRL